MSGGNSFSLITQKSYVIRSRPLHKIIQRNYLRNHLGGGGGCNGFGNFLFVSP